MATALNIGTSMNLVLSDFYPGNLDCEHITRTHTVNPLSLPVSSTAPPSQLQFGHEITINRKENLILGLSFFPNTHYTIYMCGKLIIK